MRHETWSDSRQMNNGMQFRPIEVQSALNRHAEFDRMQWLGLEARLTLTVTCTVRNYIVLTPAFITICSSCTLGIRLWRKSDIICLRFVTNCRLELAGHWLHRWAETGICILHPFELSWWKSVHTIHFKIRFFRGPNIQVSQNVVKSTLEAFWIQACSRKCGKLLSMSCRSSAESLSRSCLLSFTLSCCSSIMELEEQ